MRELLRPPRVLPGDLLGILALSGPSDPEMLARGVAFLEQAGFRVRVSPNVFSRKGPLGLAGSDEEKLRIYREFLHDPEVKALLFSRGGYGITRLLAELDPEEPRRFLKIHCGFSDLTALSSFLLTRCGIPSFHGPMVAGDLARAIDPLLAEFFPACLSGTSPRVLHVPDARILAPGEATGPLVGGCLSLLAALVGTPDEFSYDGALLFFEDIAEEAYRIDRMLVTLQRAGRLSRLSGVLVGSMASVTFGGREDATRLEEVLAERLLPLGIPVAAGLPFGHRGINVPLPVGALTTWDSEARALRFHEEIVS